MLDTEIDITQRNACVHSCSQRYAQMHIQVYAFSHLCIYTCSFLLSLSHTDTHTDTVTHTHTHILSYKTFAQHTHIPTLSLSLYHSYKSSQITYTHPFTYTLPPFLSAVWQTSPALCWTQTPTCQLSWFHRPADSEVLVSAACTSPAAVWLLPVVWHPVVTVSSQRLII